MIFMFNALNAQMPLFHDSFPCDIFSMLNNYDNDISTNCITLISSDDILTPVLGYLHPFSKGRVQKPQ